MYEIMHFSFGIVVNDSCVLQKCLDFFAILARSPYIKTLN